MSIQDEPLDLSTTAKESNSTLTEEQIQMALLEMYTQYMNEQFVAILEGLKKDDEEKNVEESLIVVDDQDQDENQMKTSKKKKEKKHVEVSKKKDRFYERRSEANARERNRVQQLSKMFDNLRECLPIQEELKISKLSTLKVATAYIDFLANLLNNQNDNESKNRLTRELESAKTLRK
ncbi:unnamed protein product [Caenorhabditis angaria]|uniref:BHLH domain-containing protein n=1 Tax=Caenorhabditis angaria TaxID=860376 RepID=A0A9P1IU97_9PELO|nr:unnamed protein product [Caenorhabditis angaria]